MPSCKWDSGERMCNAAGKAGWRLGVAGSKVERSVVFVKLSDAPMGDPSC